VLRVGIILLLSSCANVVLSGASSSWTSEISLAVVVYVSR